jgi:hypothetical protein
MVNMMFKTLYITNLICHDRNMKKYINTFKRYINQENFGIQYFIYLKLIL